MHASSNVLPVSLLTSAFYLPRAVQLDLTTQHLPMQLLAGMLTVLGETLQETTVQAKTFRDHHKLAIVCPFFNYKYLQRRRDGELMMYMD